MNTNIRMFVANKIKEYRKLNRLTQKELGEKIGVKHNTVSGYENGTNEPEQDVLFKIAEAFCISINDLFPKTKTVEDSIIMKNDETKLIGYYHKLNNIGKEEAIKRVSELSEIDKYCLNEFSTSSLTIAASGLDEDTPLSDENVSVIRERLDSLKKKGTD